MKIMHAEKIEWKRGLQHRGGTFHYRHMFDGEPGSPGNFQFNLSRIEGDFASPRHRHNFEQFRYQFEGAMDFGRNGRMTAGTFAYFPEGAHYGPQSSEGTSYTATLQFGGASGSGYLSRAEVRAGQAELEKFGTFEGGIFRRNDDVEGRRNADGYEAIWELAHGRRLEYPKPRYRTPVMIDPENYPWVPVAAGVHERFMGVFTERRTSAAFVKLDNGAGWTAPGRSIMLVVSGTGEVGDKVGGESYTARSGAHTGDGETVVFAAREETVILVMTLPDLAGIASSRRPALPAAAE